MKVLLLQFLLQAALLLKAVGSCQLFSNAVTASTDPVDVVLGMGQPQWVQLTNEQNVNVTLKHMQVVGIPAKCNANSTKWICFQIYSKSNSTGNSSVLNGTCNEEGVQKNYSNPTIQTGNFLTLQIAMCPVHEMATNAPSLEARPMCNNSSCDCLCVDACLPMWAAVRLAALCSEDVNETVCIDKVPEWTVLLSLRQHNTTNNNTHPHSGSSWFLEHVGTIVASVVALLLLGVVIVLIGCITGHWRREKVRQKSFRPGLINPNSQPYNHTRPPPPPPPPPTQGLRQQGEQEEEEVRSTRQDEERERKGEEEVQSFVSRASYEDIDVMVSCERMNSSQALVSPRPATHGSSVACSSESDHLSYRQVPSIYAMEYEIPLSHLEFWHPTPVENDIVTYISKRNLPLIQEDALNLLKKLGEGEFGCVFHGRWHREGSGGLNVAVKMARDGTCDVDRTKLLQEAAIMAQFSHENVVKVLGVVRNAKNVMIITEYLCNGDLRLYLKSIAMESPFTSRHLEELSVKLLHFSSQIAQGMKYLSQRAFVHRDLAARNILLDRNYKCKIADFGLSRDLVEADYYRSRGGKVPVKWTAPEALHYHKYTTSSDVWSYGMVLFEIWSLGHKPFEDIPVSQVANLPSNACCQAPPPGCPRCVYQLMVECWNPDADKRPSFSNIVQYLNHPEGILLHWSEADKTKSPSCAILGGELGAGHALYPDLQQRYRVVSVRKPRRLTKAKVDTLDEKTMFGD